MQACVKALKAYAIHVVSPHTSGATENQEQTCITEGPRPYAM